MAKTMKNEYIPEVLYEFKLSESIAKDDFVMKHNRWCNNPDYYTYHIRTGQIIDIECPVCHERINLNRSY